MKYAIVAAAFAGLAMAIPAEDWSNVKKCDPVEKVYTTTECGDHKEAWDNCKVATKTSTEYPCPTKKPSGCKGGKYPGGEECHDDDDEWSNWPKGCKWGKDKDGKDCKVEDNEWEGYAGKPKKDEPKKDEPKKDEPKKNDWEAVPKKEEPKKNEWEAYPVKEEKKCYATETKVYTTKECGDKKDAWDNCKDVTKTSYETKTASCTTEWVPVTPTATWTAWVDVCSATTKTYTTKECGDKKDAWDNCKDVTKVKTEYPATCTKSSTTTKKVEEETWKVWTTSAPAKTPAASTEAWTSWKPSSTVSAPVAKWTGAADKQVVGFGALAIAAVAALL